MINAKTWQDIYYETTAEELVYSVRYLGVDIFYGRAVKSPSAETLRINVSKICRDWVEAQVPSFNDGVYQGINYGVFDLVSDDGTLLSQYGFLFNWDYESVWDGNSFVMSKPINGRADSRMIMMYSVFEDTTGQTICRDEEFIKKLRIIPSYIEVSNTGVTRTIQVESNYDYSVTVDEPWLHISPLSGEKGKTVFTLTVDENALAQERLGTIHFDDSILTVLQKAAPVIIEVTPTEFEFECTSGSSTFVVSANTNYTVSPDVPWITVNASSGGPGETTFTFTVDENTGTGRNGYIIINGKPMIEVVQGRFVPIVEVYPLSIEAASSGGVYTITVTANTDYTVVASNDWISLSQNSGTTGVTTINVTIAGAQSYRDGTITIGDNVIEVYQGDIPYINVSPSVINTDYDGGTYTVSVSSNTSYDIIPDSPWITISKGSGTGNTTFTVTLPDNTTGADRTGYITVGDKTVTVTQYAGVAPYIYVSPAKIESNSSGGTFVVSVSSNTGYTISASDGWIVTSVNSGSGNTTFTVTIPDYSGVTQRDGYITVGNVTIPVVQYEAGHYEGDYLTMDILEGGQIAYKSTSNAFGRPIQYSINGGEWITANPEWGQGVYITVNAGDKVRFKGDRRNGSTFKSYFMGTNCESHQGFYLTTWNAASANISGNLLSMVYGDDFENYNEMPDISFAYFFRASDIVDASRLAIPGDTVYANQYAHMFEYCQWLRYAPVLPATNDANWHYYDGMFKNCARLISAPDINITSNNYDGCAHMFSGCTSLVNAPRIAEPTNEYRSFAASGYTEAFMNCTSLTSAPELICHTIYEGGFADAFKGCTSLNYVKCTADNFGTNATLNWLSGVSPTGTFVKNPNATWSSGASGIPTGWTVVDAS